MSSPPPFSRYRTTGDIADPSVIPKHVIVDITDEIQDFYTDSSHMQGFEFTFDEVFNEILMYLSDKDRAMENMQALREEIEIIHCKENGFDDGETLADHVVRLAQALYGKFLQLGLYTPEGVLPFETVRWVDMNTPILNRFESKPVFNGGAVRGGWGQHICIQATK